MRFEFGVATPRDDADIRELLAHNPMPGRISVAFEREPNYFAGERLMGPKVITLTAHEQKTGALAAAMCVAASPRYINGEVRMVGYMGQIRVAARYRGYLLPMRSISFIRRVARDGWPDLWFAAIVGDNPVAERIFSTKARPSFPRLIPISEIHTFGILTRRSRRQRGSAAGSLQITTAREAGLEAVSEFLRSEGPRRDFFPVYSAHDLQDPERFPGLSERDVLIAVDGNSVAGVCAVWDQSSVKQTVVQGYSGILKWSRPVANSIGRLAGLKRLPRPGEQIPSATLAAVCVENDNPQVFGALLDRASESAYAAGKDYLLAGFSTRDPLCIVAARRPHILYQSTMYVFSLDGKPGSDSLESDRVPYLEIATA